MRIVIDEDIPNELTPLFRGPGLVVEHVEDLGLKGRKNGELLTSLSGSYDVFVTGDTNLQQPRPSTPLLRSGSRRGRGTSPARRR